jgi:hypothetical protein
MALLSFALGANPPDVVPMNLRNFQIPIHVNEAQRNKIKELILFCSSDEGATWHQAAVASPDREAFVFYAPSDGVYWFNVCVVDLQGNREPADIYKSAPRQKVLVDTLSPSMRITLAERQGDDITVAWEIQEAHPDLNTLKVEYRTPDLPAWMWYTAPINPALNGQARFRFVSSEPVTVRVQMADQAGNVGNAQTLVQNKNAGASTSVAAATSPNSVPSPGSNSVTSNWPASQTGAAPAAASSSWPPVTSTIGSTTQVPAPAPTTSPVAGSAIDGSQQPVRSVSLAQTDAKAVVERSWTAASGAAVSGSGLNGQQQALVNGDTSSQQATNAANPGNPPPQAGGPHWPYNAATPLQITNNTQVTLDYEVTKVGPSGVGSVELYLTQDEGRTWQRYADDPDLKPPMTVNLPGEGVFGLRLVVGSRAGLGRRPPQSGDVPQMRIEVDTTPPVAKLFYPQPDQHRRDALVLTWNATDHNLTPNPITLQYAERPDGAWQTIAADLPNTGRYTWQLSPNLPYRVYLRLTARDTAGNSGVDETPEPVLIDLHEPEAQLLGIAGSTRRQ